MPCFAGFVYFIQAEDGGPIKIGWAKNPQQRLRELQTGNPYKLVIRRTIASEEASLLEGRLHTLLQGFRLQGEWFRPAPTVANLGDALADPDEPDEPVVYPEKPGTSYDADRRYDRWEKENEDNRAARAHWNAEIAWWSDFKARIEPEFPVLILEQEWKGGQGREPITAIPDEYLEPRAKEDVAPTPATSGQNFV